MKSKLICALILLVYSSLTYGQELHFQRVTTDDGLSNGRHWAAKCILKDKYGFVWISTVHGLNRWDGYEVETFRHDPFDSTSIHSNFVTALSQSSDGDIYIGTADKGVSKYDYKNEVFVNLGFDTVVSRTPQVNHVLCDSMGQVWIHSAFSGLYLYNIKDGSFERKPIYKDSIQNYANRGSVNGIITMKGEYAVINYHGVHVYNYQKDSFRHYTDEQLGGFSIEEGIDGNLWVSGKTWNGIKILDPDSGDFSIFDENIDQPVYCIRKDNAGEMWYGEYGFPARLTKYNIRTGETERYYHDAKRYNSFTPSTAIEILFDDRNHMWYMTSDGAGYTTLSEPYFEKLTNLPVHNIMFKNDSTLLLADDSAISSFDLKTKNRKNLHITKNNSALRPSLITSQDQLWYLDFKSHIVHIADLNGNKLHTFQGNNYESLVEDKEGNIWTSNKFDVINKSTFEIQNVMSLLDAKSLGDTIPKDIFTDLKLMKDGKIVLGSVGNGFFVYNPADTTLLHHSGKNFEPGQLTSTAVNYILESISPNKVYIATSENLNIWDRTADTFSYINPSDGLEGKILSMLEEQDSTLWVLTSEGIHKIRNDKVLAKYGSKYDLKTGVDRTDHTMVRGEDGYIYFSTSKALMRFQSSGLKNLPAPENVIIKDLFLARHRISPRDDGPLEEHLLSTKEITLGYSNRDIGFGFVSPFGKYDEVTYRYRLIGYDTTWKDNGIDNEVHFTNLDNGSYTFEVSAKSAAGLWSDKITKKKFRILAPWYKKWWAYLLFTALVFAILYAIFKYRIYQVTKYQDLRTKISSDLHDDVGTLLTSLSMQSDILGLDAPASKQAKFSKFGEMSREAMDRMRDTVWAIDSRKDQILDLVERMQDYISDMYQDHRMSISFDHKVTKMSSPIPPDVRQNIYLIFKEAVNNAMKYSNGDKVEINLFHSKKVLVLKVKDNGSENAIKKSGTGIKNMEMRAKRIKGEFNLDIENGFTIIVKVDL